ncbi:hypothetical protein METBIDRAFT_151641 [Metschnikowia bicuspidata var. bicuspidata NRRL YB-4993]|uniref:Flo11 domain-containing protein n=1 Tax=Metschnikowia bicuspidata var. bicuspidata NRRL YB-4993 TaxID=869754 RepID=A0A1A0HEK8_9ASCO|nr:hypothetical protein METBIDRAFT_151641 [Metschnikowia bicuspidata var. bicuspidata NRRL YB-4993]OBA22343.1 hypothetical protein METBIDRAFT_151641 [Metschnikowia bicuspidata var. bicuspidata NRRL YB-4993]
MKFTTLAAASVLAASACAKDVACRVGGVQQSVVDLDTGSCSFVIPDAVPVTFDFTAPDNYLVDACYALVNGNRFYNNIPEAGRTVTVPAKEMMDQGNFPIMGVHAEMSPAINSTMALRARFNSKFVSKRDAESDLVDYIMTLNGTALLDAPELSVSDVDAVSSASGVSESMTSAYESMTSVYESMTSVYESTSTATYESTTILTITSCSDDVCSESTATPTETVTNTVATTIITITSCSDDKCVESTATATQGPTTVTTDGSTTVYTTWCPVTEHASSTVITSATTGANGEETTVTVTATQGATTVTSGDETTVYTTWYTVSKEAEDTATVTTTGAEGAKTTDAGVVTTVIASTSTGAAGEETIYVTLTTSAATGFHTSTSTGAVAAQSTDYASATPAVSTVFNGAGRVSASLALIAIPFAYFL